MKRVILYSNPFVFRGTFQMPLCETWRGGKLWFFETSSFAEKVIWLFYSTQFHRFFFSCLAPRSSLWIQYCFSFMHIKFVSFTIVKSPHSLRQLSCQDVLEAICNRCSKIFIISIIGICGLISSRAKVHTSVHVIYSYMSLWTLTSSWG